MEAPAQAALPGSRGSSRRQKIARTDLEQARSGERRTPSAVGGPYSGAGAGRRRIEPGRDSQQQLLAAKAKEEATERRSGNRLASYSSVRRKQEEAEEEARRKSAEDKSRLEARTLAEQDRRRADEYARRKALAKQINDITRQELAACRRKGWKYKGSGTALTELRGRRQPSRKPLKEFGQWARDRRRKKFAVWSQQELEATARWPSAS